jgi:Flp pilus assembly protein TadB
VQRRDAEVHRITSAQPGPSRDLVSRERAYLIMMGTRMVAIVVAVVVPGVWRWVAIALGVFLPYIAVVLVNAARTRGTEDDPDFYVPEPGVAITDRPFEGTIIPHDEPTPTP